MREITEFFFFFHEGFNAISIGITINQIELFPCVNPPDPLSHLHSASPIASTLACVAKVYQQIIIDLHEDPLLLDTMILILIHGSIGITLQVRIFNKSEKTIRELEREKKKTISDTFFPSFFS